MAYHPLPTLKKEAQVIKLGEKVKDEVSGLVGIASARVEYLNGCIQYGVRARVKADGTLPDTIFIDENQLEVVGKGLAIKRKREPIGGEMFDRPKK